MLGQEKVELPRYVANLPITISMKYKPSHGLEGECAYSPGSMNTVPQFSEIFKSLQKCLELEKQLMGPKYEKETAK